MKQREDCNYPRSPARTTRSKVGIGPGVAHWRKARDAASEQTQHPTSVARSQKRMFRRVDESLLKLLPAVDDEQFILSVMRPAFPALH